MGDTWFYHPWRTLFHQTCGRTANLYLLDLGAGESLSMQRGANRHAWLQVMSGEVVIEGQPLAAGDGAALSPGGSVLLKTESGAELIWFDLA